MTSPLWQRSDGELLKALREKAGLDPVVLARMGTMTVHQLRGLEEGEGGEFYSPAIKAHMGRALLAKLGYVAPPASDAVPEAAPPPAPSPEPLSPASEPVLAWDEPRPARTLRLHRPAGLALAALSFLAIGGWFLSTSRVPASRHPVAAQSPDTQLAQAASEASLVTVATAAPAPLAATPAAPSPVAPAPAAAPAAAVASPVPADPACSPGDNRPGLAFTPSEPRKAGTFVHLVADKPVRLCVLDAAQKATRLELEPGVGRSVAGAAPFVVRGDLGHLKIFFQGVRVQGDLASGTQVVLNEAPLR